MRRPILPLILVAFVILQATASFTDTPMYPFNPYRMFSKNWQDGIGMIEYRIVAADGTSYRPWKLLDIPFFQANRLVNLSVSSERPDRLPPLCALLLPRARTNSLVIVSEGVRYRRDPGGSRPMRAMVELRKEVGRCER